MRIAVPLERPVTYGHETMPRETLLGIRDWPVLSCSFDGRTYHLLADLISDDPIQPAIDIETGDVVELDFSAVQVR